MSELFSPFKTANVEIRNRIVTPPMATEKSDPVGMISDASVDDYRRMARAGMGLLIVEHNFIDESGRVSPRQMSIARDECVPGHRRLASAIQEAGVSVALQINHSGSNRLDPFRSQAFGASSIAHPTSGVTPTALDIRGIAAIVGSFGWAAARGRQAGYDLIEIHCAHGYLLSQFLSPLTNRRRDRYGGGIAGRMRFLLEVIEEVKAATGGEYPLMVRLGLADNPPGKTLFPGGLDTADGLQVARALEKAGIAILDLSGGLCGSRPAGMNEEAYYLPLAQAARKAVRLPLLTTGGITQVDTARKIIEDGTADFVGVGRALVADPDWIAKARKARGASTSNR